MHVDLVSSRPPRRRWSDEGRAARCTPGDRCALRARDGRRRTVEVSIVDGALDELPADAGIEHLHRKLFASGGTIRSDAASAAELGLLVPGELVPAYSIARRVPGVEGFYVKSLAIAIAELAGFCEENGIESCDDVLAIMRRAEEFHAGVIFGERSS